MTRKYTFPVASSKQSLYSSIFELIIIMVFSYLFISNYLIAQHIFLYISIFFFHLFHLFHLSFFKFFTFLWEIISNLKS